MPYTHQDADRDQRLFLKSAAFHEQEGNEILAGIMRVEAGNCHARVGMKKVHHPNLGPHSDTNPRICIDCLKPAAEWVEGEECVCS